MVLLCRVNSETKMFSERTRNPMLVLFKTYAFIHIGTHTYVYIYLYVRVCDGVYRCVYVYTVTSDVFQNWISYYTTQCNASTANILFSF